jgi:hypothetical protein
VRFTTPDSDLREFNPCHDPKNGQFAPKGANGCNPGNLDDPGRLRSAYAATDTVEDAEARVRGLAGDPTSKSADGVGNALLFKRLTGGPDAGPSELKDGAARTVGDGMEGLVTDEQAEAFLDDIGYNGPEDSDGGGDMEALKSKYEDEYNEYESGLVDEYVMQKESEYFERREKSKEVIDNAISDLAVAITDARDILIERGELTTIHDGAMDVLPGIDNLTTDDLRNSTMETPDAAALGQLVADYLLDDLSVEEIEGVGFNLSEEPDHRDPNQQRDAVEFRDNAIQALGRITAPAGTPGKTEEERLVNWLSGDAGEEIRDEVLKLSNYYDPDSDYDGRGRKFEDNETDWRNEGYSNSNADSIEKWIEDNYGDELTDSDSDSSDYTLTQKVATTLISKWAGTSGDADPTAIAVQLAANEVHGLGATFTGQFITRSDGARSGVIASAQFRYERHKAVFDAFVKATYEATQESFREKGLDPEKTYVTLYRGMSLPNADGSLDGIPNRGAILDILTQPLSSFSSSQSTAKNFMNTGTGTVPAFTAVRVPLSQVFSTPLTGNGCTHESEFVLLGGRFPAYVTTKGQYPPYLSNLWKDGSGYKGDVPDAVDRWLKDMGKFKVTVAPGDRV